MPAVFAHWLLGEKSLESLDKNHKNIILKYRTAFNLGLQGPDFMLFKDMGGDREIFELADALHSRPAAYAISGFSKAYKSDPNPESLAYILGFIGHFALDTNCHWYVYKVVDEDKTDHNELETEFDRHLMTKENLEASKVKIEDYISTDNANLDNIISLYKGFNEIEAEKYRTSFIHFYKYKKIIRIIQSKFPFLINSGLKLFKKEEFFGVFMKKKKNMLMEKYMISMEECFNKALEIYPVLVENFLNSLGGDKLSEYFDRNFLRKEENN